MNNIRTNSPSFGMALFAPTQKKVAKVLGKEAAAEFEKQYSYLEEALVNNGDSLEGGKATMLLDEFRSGKIGRISLDIPEDLKR